MIGGWQTSNVFTVRSGPWLTPYFPPAGTPRERARELSGLSQHPDRVGAAYSCPAGLGRMVPGLGLGPPPDCLVGTTSRGAPPPIGHFGHVRGRHAPGSGHHQLGLGSPRTSSFTERASLKFEVSFVNVMNHINLGNPDMKITDTNAPSSGKCGFGCIASAPGLLPVSPVPAPGRSARVSISDLSWLSQVARTSTVEVCGSSHQPRPRPRTSTVEVRATHSFLVFLWRRLRAGSVILSVSEGSRSADSG